ncbi:unnamed protein product [Euphydryas editha]|uniref:Reverse transcriptase domain-containing protein n=1 Tax=Euphydryas editha TaxID=104508 RepID=A0AAU9UCM2_EUPED|nr:unnamed protein product [Euphydryas editha]
MKESYLSNRKQRVKIGDLTSADVQVTYGVPQGSVIGPTLFLIYINPLCSLKLDHCRIFTFADDTAMIFYGKTWQDVRTKAEEGLRIATRWLQANILTLNESKTKFLTFGTSKATLPEDNFTIKIHGCRDIIAQSCQCTEIERLHTIKYLGVLVDETLTWKPHIELIAERVRKLIYIFRYLRQVADSNLIKTVYFALAQSILSFCLLAWGGANKTNMIVIERAQRALLKVMTFKPYKFSTWELYTECEVLSVRKLFILQTILAQHKKVSYTASKKYSSRRIKNVCPALRVRTTFIKKFQCFIGPHLYNKMNKILSINSLNQYDCKHKIINWLKSLSYDEVENLFKIVR